MNSDSTSYPSDEVRDLAFGIASQDWRKAIDSFNVIARYRPDFREAMFRALERVRRAA